jgi:hypothetical protein
MDQPNNNVATVYSPNWKQQPAESENVYLLLWVSRKTI